MRHGAVYDLGGGTFDFAIVDCSAGADSASWRTAAIRTWAATTSTARSPTFVADVVLREHGWDLRSDAEVFARLVLAAEQAKLQLSHASSAAIELEAVDPAAPLGDCAPIAIEQSTLRELSAALIRRTFVVCDQVLRQRRADRARHPGGVHGRRHHAAARRARRGRALLRPRLRYELDPMHVVSLGASIAAARPRFAPLLDEA